MTATLLFFVLGAITGAVQAVLLARAARRPARAIGGLARIALVAAILLGAAHAGQLLATAVGWLSGFGVAVAVLVRRPR